MKYVLPPEEMDLCIAQGKLRQAANARAYNSNPKKCSPKRAEELHIIGFIGEWAFSKVFDTKVDMTTHPRVHGFDQMMDEKIRLDVKSTDCEYGNLFVHIDINRDVDKFVLAIVLGNIVTFIGWAWSNEVYLESNIKDIGYGDTYIVSRKKLHPIQTIHDDH